MPGPRIFDSTPQDGDPLSKRGIFRGLRRLAEALENLSVHNGRVHWSGYRPKIIVDVADGGSGETPDHNDLEGLDGGKADPKEYYHLPAGVEGRTVVSDDTGNPEWRSEIFVDRYNEWVGVGTTGPTQKLHVEGGTRLDGHLFGKNNLSGENDQVLTRKANGPEWADAPEAGDTLPAVFSADKNKVLIVSSGGVWEKGYPRFHS